MNTVKRPHSVLVVSGSDKAVQFFRALLPQPSFNRVDTVGNAGEAKRMLISSVYDIIIVDTPLSDEFGYELAVDIAGNSTSGVMLLVRNDIFDRVADKVEPFGVLTLAKPLTKQAFWQSARLITATRERLREMEKKNRSLNEKMEEIRLVNRAKWVLIDRLGMDEHQAHRYIEKQAMDLRISRTEVARNIINTHES